MSQRIVRYPVYELVHNLAPKLLWVSGSALILSVLIVCVQLGKYSMKAQMVDVQAAFEEKQLLFETDRKTLQEEIARMQLEHDRMTLDYSLEASESVRLKLENLEKDVALVEALDEKLTDYKKQGVKVATVESTLREITSVLIKRDSQTLQEKVKTTDTLLEKLLADKKVQDAKLAALSTITAPIAAPGGGYSRVSVATDRGTFVVDIIKASLGSATVVTVTGNDGNCDNNCVAKPLAEYITQEGGYAGINGSYFCPPDYPSCSGKTYSFDFPVYRTKDHKWINADKLFWNDRGMAAFMGHTPRFCGSANGCDNGSISAGIVNYPALLDGGNIIVNEGSLPASLTQTKGLRGGIGVNGSNVYLMVVRSATVTDVAHVMKSLGLTHGLNLDGGGSSALYYNGYKVGPGRLLPNAVVIK